MFALGSYCCLPFGYICTSSVRRNHVDIDFHRKVITIRPYIPVFICHLGISGRWKRRVKLAYNRPVKNLPPPKIGIALETVSISVSVCMLLVLLVWGSCFYFRFVPDTNEIKRRIAMARQKAVELTTTWKDKNVTSALKIRVMKSMVWAVFQYGVEGWTLKKSDRNRIESFEMWCWRKMLRISWKEHRTNYINIRRDWSGKGVNRKVGSDETTVLWTRYQGKCRKFGTDSLGAQYRWFTSPRKTQKTMDGRHRRVEWL